ncbi:DHHC palmitoyltransferase-domain-containing protein [Absidia repens]|uniref:Palmitoyltransferase PFA4 n=1 Tax=Absidia repens TaxID=90262 RepID=A0A1X2IYV4_9FUNG|nr:DHHC palmitoyltransferase-domain-containing protein [Absidia repens]
MLDSIPGQVFVVGVLLLISTIAYSSQYFIFIPALRDSLTLSAFQVLVPFNIFVLLIYYNYYLAVTTNPGKIPSNWKPPAFITELSNNKESNPDQPITTPPRFCKTCQLYKPPRTHHCRYCHCCVLKMDHHCPWINNCVGIYNYPHFLRFIFFVNLSCTYVLVLLIWRTRCIMDAIRHFRFDAEPTTTEVIFLVINFVLSIVVLFSVGILGGYHLYCLLRNQSTIEAWERGKVETLVRRRKIPPFDYPFGLGIYKNICSVLGKNPLLWLWPTRNGVTGDGLIFEVPTHIDPRSQHFWPPRDPDDLRPSIFSSKYKRQQERRQQLQRQRQWKLHQQQQQQEGGEMELDPLMMTDGDDVDDSEDYYDSGSFVTDSDDEYSLTDEEHNMQKFVSGSIYNLAGVSADSHQDHHHHHHHHYNNNETTTNHRHNHRLLQQQQQQQQQQSSSQSATHTPQLYYPDDSSDNDDADHDDTIPLSSFLSRSSPSKDTKED